MTREDLVFISCIDSCVDDVMIPSDLNFITMFALKQNGAIRCDFEFDLANIYYDHQVCKTHHYKSKEREKKKRKKKEAFSWQTTWRLQGHELY